MNRDHTTKLRAETEKVKGEMKTPPRLEVPEMIHLSYLSVSDIKLIKHEILHRKNSKQ